jgi:hypothetical protein
MEHSDGSESMSPRMICSHTFERYCLWRRRISLTRTLLDIVLQCSAKGAESSKVTTTPSPTTRVLALTTESGPVRRGRFTPTRAILEDPKILPAESSNYNCLIPWTRPIHLRPKPSTSQAPSFCRLAISTNISSPPS